MKRSLKLFASFVAASLTISLLSIDQSLAVGSVSEGAVSARAADQPATLFGDTGVFSQISSVLLFIVGAIAVIMIVIGGLRYVVSGGDAALVSAAKNTILYALVGIIIAILAYAAVNFVIGSFVPSANNSGTSGYGSSTR